MDKNIRSSFSDRSVDDLLDQQLNAMRYQHLDAPDYSTDPLYMQNSSNMYYPDQFQSAEARNTLPFVFNTREDVVPAMVGMGGGNYMVFGTSAAEKSMNVSNVQFANKTNGALSGMNSYQVEYPADYNLFSGGINPGGSSFNSQQDISPSPSTPHLIENLVGHWASDQSGTYSPFGSCISPTQSQHANNAVERGAKKTRIVAEVRPMRPSYSDVLSKSVPNQPKVGKPIDGKMREMKEAKNGKTIKSSVGRSLSGCGQPGRHFLSGDDPTRSGSNSSLKMAGMKKSTDTEPEEPLTKKWVSLDDLTGGMSENNFMDDAKTKKNSNNKHTTAKKQVKDGWETIQLNNGKSTVGKTQPPAKKTSPIVITKPVLGEKERESTPGLKFEQTKTKPSPEDRKVPVNTQPKSADSGKNTRRNSRGLQAERAKRTVRGRRREAENWWTAVFAQRADIVVAYVLWAARWLVTLVLDVCALSTNLGFYMCTVFWSSSVSSLSENYLTACNWLRDLSLSQRITSSRFWPFKQTEKSSSSSDSDSDSDSGEVEGKKKRKRLPGGLKHNLPLPSTGEEAMKRLLACKGKDPYSILGVSQDCTDDDIKRYYKRQAFLVHPDKNNQPGAEEAFKILVHAFDIIGEPEHRKTYDRSVEKSAQAAQAWSELSELLAQLHKKMEYVANTIRCTNCGKRHKRTAINRPIYAARMCAQCKICHSAREGDIWAETSMFGMVWRYFACMDGGLYDISEWAACQGNNLKNLKANTHQVQYRIVLGKQAAHKTRSQPTASPASGEPDLEEFINNLYSKPESNTSSDMKTPEGGVRSRKHKRKK